MNVHDFALRVAPRVTVQCVYVMGSTCMGCGERTGEESLVALGYPYLAIAHEACVPFIDFSNRWPHPEPTFTYRQRLPPSLPHAPEAAVHMDTVQLPGYSGRSV